MKSPNVPAVPLALLLLACAPVLSGCLAEVLTVTAIQGELAAQNASSAQRALSHAKDSAAGIEIQSAINAYVAERGANPPSLEALVPGFLKAVPTQANGQPYYYDAASATFSDSPIVTGPVTDADRQSLATIQDAINRYGTATGYYPPTLQALADNGYLASVPKTSSGKDFIFYTTDGTLLHPDEQSGQWANSGPAISGGSRGGGTAGSGPLGEVTTGIAISNQLDSMSTGGTAAVGSHGRQGARVNTGDYSNRQMDALKKYGVD